VDPSGEEEIIKEKMTDAVSPVSDYIGDVFNKVGNFIDSVDLVKFLKGSGQVIGGVAVGAAGVASCSATVVVCVPVTIGGGMVTAPAGGVGGVVGGGICLNVAAVGCVSGLGAGGALISTGFSNLMQSKQSGNGGEYDKQSNKQLGKSKQSFEKRVSEHENKIKNPDIDPAKIKGDPIKYQEGLIKHWKKEIQTFKNEIDKISKLLNL